MSSKRRVGVREYAHVSSARRGASFEGPLFEQGSGGIVVCGRYARCTGSDACGRVVARVAVWNAIVGRRRRRRGISTKEVHGGHASEIVLILIALAVYSALVTATCTMLTYDSVLMYNIE